MQMKEVSEGKKLHNFDALLHLYNEYMLLYSPIHVLFIGFRLGGGAYNKFALGFLNVKIIIIV